MPVCLKGTDFISWWCHRQASFGHIYAGTDSTFFFQPQRDYFNKIYSSSRFSFSLTTCLRKRENQFLICTKIFCVWSPSLGVTHQKAGKLLWAAMQWGNGTRTPLSYSYRYGKKGLKKGKQERRSLFSGSAGILKVSENRRGKGVWEKCCFISFCEMSAMEVFPGQELKQHFPPLPWSF